ncbi:MAG: YfhO family protein [Nitrospiraceae bacterium]
MKKLTVGKESEAQDGLRPLARSSTGLAIAALCGIALAFYYRLWLPDLVLIKRDAFRYFLPMKQYLREQLATGDLPQWFPYEGLGCPVIGPSGLGMFHPFTVLYFLLPVPDAYRAATLVACLLAGLGAFALGRTLALSHAGALLSGVAFALSGYVVSLTDNLLYLYSICALPLFCAGLEKALKSPVAWVVVPAVVWATVFLHGDLQTGYYYGLIALLWVLARVHGSYQQAVVRLALIAALAALIGGIQLGPAAAAYAGSERAQPEFFRDQALHWSTHPLRLPTLLASPVGGKAHPVVVSHLFFGGRSAGERVELWAESLYVGVPVAGLALVGTWARRDLRVLTLLGGLALWLALGRFGGLYEVFYHVVPMWSAFRYPEKLMGVASFSVAMLAGAGVDALREGRGRPIPWFIAAVLCAGVGLSLWTEQASVWMATIFGAPEDVAREVAGSAAQAFAFSALATLGVGTVVAGTQRGWLQPELSLAFLIGIVTIDLFRANLAAYHTGPVEAATFTPGLVEALSRHANVAGPGHFRIVTLPDSRIAYPKSFDQWLDLLGASSLLTRQKLDLEHNTPFRIESIAFYQPGHDPATAALIATVRQKFEIEAAARYNVAYFIGRSQHFQSPRFAKVLVAYVADYDLALVHNPVPVKPRAYLSLRPERTSSSVDLAALLARRDFLSGEVDVIETEETTLPGPTRGGSAVIERYAPEEVLVRVSTPEPAVLILLDAFDAGWRAVLETGAGLPILRANGLVRAVVVPAGDHVLTFRYQTPLLKAGALASLAGLVIGLALVAHGWWLMRRPSAAGPPT